MSNEETEKVIDANATKEVVTTGDEAETFDAPDHSFSDEEVQSDEAPAEQREAADGALPEQSIEQPSDEDFVTPEEGPVSIQDATKSSFWGGFFGKP